MTTTPKAKIYTKTGDQGETRLVDGSKALKSHPRVEAYGTLDELNSHIGLIRALLSKETQSSTLPQVQQLIDTLNAELTRVQIELFNAGALLATPAGETKNFLPPLSMDATSLLEQSIDVWTAELPELKNFILPGGTEIAGHLHIVRTLCRRAERLVVGLEDNDKNAVLIFLNRLSDYFFVAARIWNHRQHQPEILWRDLRKNP